MTIWLEFNFFKIWLNYQDFSFDVSALQVYWDLIIKNRNVPWELFQIWNSWLRNNHTKFTLITTNDVGKLNYLLVYSHILQIRSISNFFFFTTTKFSFKTINFLNQGISCILVLNLFSSLSLFCCAIRQPPVSVFRFRASF